MYQKYFSLSLLAFAFLFIAGSVQAQMAFYNSSSCFITVEVTVEQNSTPCSGLTCTAPAVNIPPGGTASIPAPACLTTPAGLGYRSVKVTMFGVPTIAADRCFGPNPVSFRDCSGTLKQLYIVSPSDAGIF